MIAMAYVQWPTNLLVTDPQDRAQFIHQSIDAYFPVSFDLDYQYFSSFKAIAESLIGKFPEESKGGTSFVRKVDEHEWQDWIPELDL